MLTPFYANYPKDVAENLRWRIACRERALVDERFKNALYDACMSDVLLFMAFCCWSLEPRAQAKIRPFIPWSHQEPVFVAMDEAIDDAEREEKAIDVILDKSRAQGGTFGYLWIDLRRWLRDRMFSAGYVTRNEMLVDSATDADTLFWKLAWAIGRLPCWMAPPGFDMKKHRSLSAHSLLNPANGATLVGYSAGQDVGTGGRKSVFTCDEFGAKDFIAGGKDASVMESLHDVTNVIRMVSARYADSGVFHEACENPDHGGLHLILDWKDNPIHGKHSYVVRNGKPEAVKPGDQEAVDAYHADNPDLQKRLERKGFKFVGVVRSPWYDMRCLRPTSTPRLIASQLDRDPRGAVGKVFPSDLLDMVNRENCKAPIWQGVPVFDSENLVLTGLLSRDDGPLKLWFKPGVDNSPPLGPFTVGCDIATGSDGVYSSNSVASIIDDRTGEQVGEYTIKGMPAIKFARNVVGLCRWLRNAFLGWEDSGMAAPFAKEVLEVLHYGRVYYRDVAEIGSRRKTRKAGWYNGKNEDKADLFEKMALAMETGEYTIRSGDLIRECGEYEWEKGKIIHQPTKNHGATEKAHGDRCLVAGTLILTDKGEVPIEAVTVGDLVWTRNGLRPVEFCGETGLDEVFRLTVSNGRTLTGTGNHPVWTENRSWVPLQSLRGSDKLLPCRQQNQFAGELTSVIHPLRRSSSTAGGTIGTQMPGRGIEGFTSGEGGSTATARRSRFMSLFGSITAGLSRTAILFTTKTTTRSTMISRISNVLRLPSMGKFTKTAAICQGTRTARGIAIRANTAGLRTGHSGSTAQSSAVRNVVKNIARKSGYAPFAGRNIAQRAEVKRGHVPSNAEYACVINIEKLAKPAKVYNLSVAGVPEYFAQGILVHNCIAAGVAWLIYSQDAKRDNIDTGEETMETPQYGSFLWREQQERRRSDPDSPDFCLLDVVGR